jgi:hypothetical protein
MAKRQKTKWQTTIYKTLQRKLKISEAVNYLFVFLPLCFLSWYLQLLRPLVFCAMFSRSLFVILSMVYRKLKISEAVNIRTENTMAKRQNDKQRSRKHYTEN